MIRARSDEGRAIRALVAKAKGTEMRRIKNTYFARLWVEPESKDEDAKAKVFPRPEK